MNSHTHEIFTQIVGVFSIALLASYLSHRARISPILGYLLAGIVFGASGVGVLSAKGTIEAIAETGIIFLLFSVGLKFSFSQLRKMKSLVFGLGFAQLILTALLLFPVTALLFRDVSKGVFISFLLSLSSTALVLHLLESKGDSDSQKGRMMIGILLFQDLAVIPLALLYSGESLFGRDIHPATGLFFTAMALSLLAVSAWFIYPKVLEKVAAVRSRDTFVLLTTVLVIGTAWGVSFFGVSPALGAFMAGVIVSRSRFATQMLSDLGPAREAFNSIFFVSLGMLVDLQTLSSRPILFIMLLILLLVVKSGVVMNLCLLWRAGVVSSVFSGLALSQVGEFALVLLQAGRSSAVISETDYSLLLGVSVASMLLTPILLSAHRNIEFAVAQVGRRLHRQDSWRALVRKLRFVLRFPVVAKSSDNRSLDNHVIVVGYGVNGENVTRVLRKLNIPCLIVEMNPATVRALQEEGTPVIYGEAASRDVLSRASISTARALVNTVSHFETTRAVLDQVRRMKPELMTISRTRYLHHADHLSELGSSHIVVEEFETAIELVGLVMSVFGVSPRAIYHEQQKLRAGRYRSFLRKADGGVDRLQEILLFDDVTEMKIEPSWHSVGKTLTELDLRKISGASVLAIVRADEVITNPDSALQLQEGDTVLLFGNGMEIEMARSVLIGSHTPNPQ